MEKLYKEEIPKLREWRETAACPTKELYIVFYLTLRRDDK
jgi:hypothetical protein